MSKTKNTSAVQKKKRLTQLRDAQRRRRIRLKSDQKHFVQIILPQTVLDQLQIMIADTGETMQQAIGRLVESSLPQNNSHNGTTPVPNHLVEEMPIPTLEQPVEIPDSGDVIRLEENETVEPVDEHTKDPVEQIPPTEILEEERASQAKVLRAGQLDLFG